jgi:AmmeMemoRadiSam system protein B
MNRIRPAAVAGTFYPADPRQLADQIDRDLAATTTGGTVPKALIAPHAGYIYSGPIAASAYAQIIPAADIITRVVLLGPAHRVPVRSMAVPSVDGFATPLGTVTIDGAAREQALLSPGVVVDDEAHAAEHSLEVHLPFLQRILGDAFTVVPIVVGDASPAEVDGVLERLWGGPETLIVVSSDLSHFHDYATACDRDRVTAAAITERELDHIGPRDACGAAPVRGLLQAARRLDLEVSLLDLANSGDTAGEPDRVVGYGAFAIQ